MVQTTFSKESAVMLKALDNDIQKMENRLVSMKNDRKTLTKILSKINPVMTRINNGPILINWMKIYKKLPNKFNYRDLDKYTKQKQRLALSTKSSAMGSLIRRKLIKRIGRGQYQKLHKSRKK